MYKKNINPKFKLSRMVEEEAELWADGYIQAMLLYPDFDKDRHIYRTYPINVEVQIRNKLKEILQGDLVEQEFPICYLANME